MPEYEANPAEGLIGVPSSVPTSIPGTPLTAPTFHPAGGEPIVVPTAAGFDETTEPIESAASNGRFLSMKNRYLISAIVSGAILVGVVLIKQHKVKPHALSVASADDASKDPKTDKQATDKNASDEKPSDIDKKNTPPSSTQTANGGESAKGSERDAAIAPNSEEPVVIATNDESQPASASQSPSDPRPDPSAIPASIDESKPGERSTAANGDQKPSTDKNTTGSSTPTDPAKTNDDAKIAETSAKESPKNPQDKSAEPPAAPNPENAQANTQTSLSSNNSSVDTKQGVDNRPSKGDNSPAKSAETSTVAANEAPVVAPPSADPIAPAPVPAGSSGPLPAPPPSPASNELPPAAAPQPATIDSPNTPANDQKPAAQPITQNPVEPPNSNDQKPIAPPIAQNPVEPPNSNDQKPIAPPIAQNPVEQKPTISVPAVQSTRNDSSSVNAKENHNFIDVNSSNPVAPTPPADKIDPQQPNPAAFDRGSANAILNDPARDSRTEPSADSTRANPLNHNPADRSPARSIDTSAMNAGDWIPIPNATGRSDLLAANDREFGSSLNENPVRSSDANVSQPSAPPAATIVPHASNPPAASAEEKESNDEATDSDVDSREPIRHVVERGENFWTISRLYYDSGRYYKALWAANRDRVPAIDRLYVGTALRIPPPEALDPALIEPPAGLAPLPDRSNRVGVAKKSGSTRGGSIARVSSDRLDDQDERAERIAEPTEIRSTVRRPKRRVSFEDIPEGPIPQKYVVKRYDTIRSIARDMLGDVARSREILELNKDLIDDSDNLPVGRTILLPEDARPRRILR
jgi:nucleoid-associated protein YgaU